MEFLGELTSAASSLTRRPGAGSELHRIPNPSDRFDPIGVRSASLSVVDLRPTNSPAIRTPGANLRTSRPACLAAAVCLGLSACTGVVEAPSPGGFTEPPPPPPSTSAAPPRPESDPTPVRPGPIQSPLRRLTRFEINNTVELLFGDTRKPARLLPGEEYGNGFGNSADAQSVTPVLVEGMLQMAETVAQRAVDDPAILARYAPCLERLEVASDREACVEAFLATWLPLAFRRSVPAEELSAYRSLYTELAASSPRDSLAGVITAALLSPDFVYRPEFGVVDPTSPSGYRPSGFERASRLAFFLLGSGPTAALMEAARAGELDRADGVAKWARRLLEDRAARDVVFHFFDRILLLSAARDVSRDARLFPDFGPEIVEAMLTETRLFLEHVIFETDGDWRTMISAPYTFLDRRLADFYGIVGVDGEAFHRVDLPGTRRRGLLTQGAFLVGTTSTNLTNPVRRGGLITADILCMHVPLPSAEFDEFIVPPNPETAPTARERYTEHLVNPVCKTCHDIMDPPGFILEHFDPVGRWRDQENGASIDGTGTLPGSDIQIDGPASMALVLADHPDAQNCFVDHWLRFSLGRNNLAFDPYSRAQAMSAFEQSGYRIKELLVALTQTNQFLYMEAPQ